MTTKPKPKKEPFFQLRYSMEKGVLRLDPYPLMDEERMLGPRFNILSMFPDITAVTIEIEPVFFYCPTSGGGAILDYTQSDIRGLAEKVEATWAKASMRREPINAFLLHNCVQDDRLMLRGQEREQFSGGYCILPVQFFTVKFGIPEDLLKARKILQVLGL